MILNNCFEAKTASRIRPLTDKGLDQACQSLATLVWVMEDQFFPHSNKKALKTLYLALKQSNRTILDYLKKKESLYECLFPEGETPATFDKFYSTFFKEIAQPLPKLPMARQGKYYNHVPLPLLLCTRP